MLPTPLPFLDPCFSHRPCLSFAATGDHSAYTWGHARVVLGGQLVMIFTVVVTPAPGQIEQLVFRSAWNAPGFLLLASFFSSLRWAQGGRMARLVTLLAARRRAGAAALATLPARRLLLGMVELTSVL